MDTNSTAARLSILIADDHTLILEIVGMALAGSPDIDLVTTSSVAGVIEQIDLGKKFDLILLDLDMPGMSGLETLRKIEALNEGRPVGILTGNPTPRVVEEMSRHGAAGVIPKTTSMRSLTNAIRFMAAGERYYPLELMQFDKPSAESSASSLSKREMAVLAELADGKTNRDIGLSLTLADPTVKMHVKSICRKLGATNRTQAVVMARDLKLI